MNTFTMLLIIFLCFLVGTFATFVWAIYNRNKIQWKYMGYIIWIPSLITCALWLIIIIYIYLKFK